MRRAAGVLTLALGGHRAQVTSTASIGQESLGHARTLSSGTKYGVPASASVIRSCFRSPSCSLHCACLYEKLVPGTGPLLRFAALVVWLLVSPSNIPQRHLAFLWLPI
ncbi:hypothetical protein GGI35DRAFT_437736 [Trichoderma velutinum]